MDSFQESVREERWDLLEEEETKREREKEGGRDERRKGRKG